jgi:conjugative transfer region protein (TIGR03750 family)
MTDLADRRHDDAVTFLPHRLNRQPVVVRGLTADELWICVGLCGSAGLFIGLVLAWLTATIAVMPTVVVITVALGVFVGGNTLRRHKRGRPDTWLYRQLQWRLALRHQGFGSLVGGADLVTRSGYWTTRRSSP